MSITPQTIPPFGPGAKSRPNPARVLVYSALLVILDFVSGPQYAVSVFFVLPVIYAAWYQGFRFACFLAAGLSIMRFMSNWAWGFPMSHDTALVNNVLRAVTLILVAFLTEQLASQMRALKTRQERLESQLPICPECGLACRHDGQWVPLEDGTMNLSKTTPPKSLCPECERRNYDVQPG
ncbi:DUF4118 domain-containing protein [Rariglobus hedericola]|uniref:DUF4118 domain-containing protein n=1 Tax=Rariglobus hedericola TaxID=2597822 RepID=A0A556QS24_9BACT|nr:DUF4118 domain-containing protein [Rariglobus hedericola]TSJ79445.1 hypothetical protein FPL22_09200 [Rariglobus hedericola]